MILAVCRKHPEVSVWAAGIVALAAAAATVMPPFSCAAHATTAARAATVPHLRVLHLSFMLQGIQDTLLEKELPDVPVNDRAMAINALLSSLKLQVGAGAHAQRWACWNEFGWNYCGGLQLAAGCLKGAVCQLLGPCPGCPPTPQILVNPADPSSHIYKANSVGDAARCAAAGC